MKEFYWNWRGAVAIILALGLSGTVVVLASGSIPHINTDEATVISTVLGAVVGALATYLGGKHTNDNGRSNGNGHT